ncbi:MAG: hypothetical protein ACFCU8_02720 [Thermosynechococcaceae cyanobacterium]
MPTTFDWAIRQACCVERINAYAAISDEPYHPIRYGKATARLGCKWSKRPVLLEALDLQQTLKTTQSLAIWYCPLNWRSFCV